MLVLYVSNFLWEDNWYCTRLIFILLSLYLPNPFLSVYKNMSDCMQKHPAADVLISFASLRSAYESTIETLTYKQVRDPRDAFMKLQFPLALFVKPLFSKWHKDLHWLPHARTYVCMHTHTHAHTMIYMHAWHKAKTGNYLRIGDSLNTSYVTFFRSEPLPSLLREFQRIWLVRWSMLPRRKVSPSSARQRWGFFLVTDGSLLIPDQKVEMNTYFNQNDTYCKFWGQASFNSVFLLHALKC